MCFGRFPTRGVVQTTRPPLPPLVPAPRPTPELWSSCACLPPSSSRLPGGSLRSLAELRLPYPFVAAPRCNLTALTELRPFSPPNTSSRDHLVRTGVPIPSTAFDVRHPVVRGSPSPTSSEPITRALVLRMPPRARQRKGVCRCMFIVECRRFGTEGGWSSLRSRCSW